MKTQFNKNEEQYKSAIAIAQEKLKATSPIRLGLALSYSTYCYEVNEEAHLAYQIAKKAFDDAILDIDLIDEDQYKDATTIMQLLRDNIILWSEEVENKQQQQS